MAIIGKLLLIVVVVLGAAYFAGMLLVNWAMECADSTTV